MDSLKEPFTVTGSKRDVLFWFSLFAKILLIFCSQSMYVVWKLFSFVWVFCCGTSDFLPKYAEA